MTNELTFFSSLTDKEPKLMSWESVATIIRGDQLQKLCSEYQSTLAVYEQAKAAGDKERERHLKSQLAHIKQQCPAIMPQAMVEGGRSANDITRFMPYMIVDLDHLPADKMAAVADTVKKSEYAHLAYRTISGHGLRVIVKMDGDVTKDNFKDAWLSANEKIKEITGVEYDNQCGNVNRLCGLAHDPKAVYRPLSKALKIKSFKTPKQKAGRRPSSFKAGATARSLVEGEGVEYVEGNRNRYVSRAIYWMNRFGISEEKTLKWALEEFDEYDAANGYPVAGIVKSIYGKHSGEHNTCRPSAFNTESRTSKATIMEVEAFLTARYRFRRNILSQQVEYTSLIPHTSFLIPLTDAAENTLWIDMQRAGLNTDMQTLHAYLTSNYVEEFHPVKHYLESLPEWDGHDHIADLLGMVHCRDCPPTSTSTCADGLWRWWLPRSTTRW